jgi:hypothetical protein
MPFQPGESGNPNGKARHVKPWREAILRATKRREHEDPLALEKLADKLIRKVEEGDIAAIKEYGDRMDGKVAQAIIGGSEDDPAIKVEHIRLIGVRPGDKDT